MSFYLLQNVFFAIFSQPITGGMNMRITLLYLCFSFLFLKAFGQQRNDRQLYSQYLKEIKNLKEDTNKVNVDIKYARLLKQPDTALLVIDKGMKLSYRFYYAKG